jgi:hypothetical protein
VIRHNAEVLMKVWRWVLAVVSGAGAAIALFGLVRLFHLFASDAAPRMTLRWAPMVLTAGGVASGVVAIVATLFVARAATGPALVRRIGGGLAALGVIVAVGGVALFFVPLKPPVHPGRMPAGDVAGGTISLLVVFAGGILLAVGLLVALAGLGWSWARRTKHSVSGQASKN